MSLPSKGARRVRGLDLIFSASVQAEAGVPDNRVVTRQASGFHPRFKLSSHLCSVRAWSTGPRARGGEGSRRHLRTCGLGIISKSPSTAPTREMDRVHTACVNAVLTVPMPGAMGTFA